MEIGKLRLTKCAKFRNKWAVYRHLRLRLSAAGNRLRVGAELVTPSPTDANTAMSATYREQRDERSIVVKKEYRPRAKTIERIRNGDY